MGRQLQLRCENTILDLNNSTYTLLAANGFVSVGNMLEIKVLVRPKKLAELDQLTAPINRLLSAAKNEDPPVYVYTKTCDDLIETAEIGATWLRKRVRGGKLVVYPLTGTAAEPISYLVLKLDTEDMWRRAVVAPFIECNANDYIMALDNGGITVNNVALTARRKSWTSQSGVVARYRWLAANGDCTFFSVAGTSIAAYWNNAEKRFSMRDNASPPRQIQSAQYTFAADEEVDVIFGWFANQKMCIIVNGVAFEIIGCSFAQADMYTLFQPIGPQVLQSAQVWPANSIKIDDLRNLHTWGRPEAELAYVIPPPNDKNTNCWYKIYNVPGEMPAGLRIIARAKTTNEDQLALALRPYRIPNAVAFECEDGTPGAATTKVLDTSASGSYVMRFTPTDMFSATRVTIVFAANPENIATGDYRLFLACKDNATAVNTNLVKYRIRVGGVYGEYSDEVACGVVGVRSLLDLGTFSLPPGAWPEESDSAATRGYGTSYGTIELAIRNTLGSAGGTFDLDCLYLTPMEYEGAAIMPDWNSQTQWAVLDWTGRPSGILAYDERSLEFGGWADWTGDVLEVPPGINSGGLWGYALRNTSEEAYPNDEIDLLLFYEPRWMRDIEG